MFGEVSADAFAVLAEPTRRRILDRLRTADHSVGELAAALGVSQPTMSKHLKVLREARFISRRVVAQQRIYRLESAPLRDVDRWLAPYRQVWTAHVDALERHLDAQAAPGPAPVRTSAPLLPSDSYREP
jgi:DNA-binding transcriptional ArsR family regulator